MLVMVVIAALAGYAVGTLIAVFLNRLYTGAPLRGPLGWHGHEGLPGPWWAWWTGTLGYALARGRCACGEKLPAPAWYLPLLGAGAGVATALFARDARHAALVALFTPVLLGFAGTDWERHLLPNRLMYPALGLGVLLCWAWPDHNTIDVLAGGAVGFAVLFVLFLALPGLGFGDVKLGGLVGLLSGLAGLFPAFTVGIMAAGVAAVGLLLTRRAGRKSMIAYGPFLALGAFFGMLNR